MEIARYRHRYRCHTWCAQNEHFSLVCEDASTRGCSTVLGLLPVCLTLGWAEETQQCGNSFSTLKVPMHRLCECLE